MAVGEPEGVDGEGPGDLTPEEHAWLQERLQDATLLEVENDSDGDWQDPSGGLLEEIFGACEGGMAQDLGVLLNQLKDTDFSINTPGRDGDTPLHIACLYGTTACVQQLLAHGCDPTAVNPEDQSTVLHDAAAGGHLEIAELLIEKTGAALLDLQDMDGDTPLHNAARGGHGRMVRLLLAEGADPTIANLAGHTPLAEADDGEVQDLLSAALEVVAAQQQEEEEEEEEGQQQQLNGGP